MSEAEVKVRVSDEDFARFVREAANDGTGIDGIAAKTGLKRNSVNTRLANLRKLVGKENVPSFQGGPRKEKNKDRLVAILKGEVQEQA